MTSTSANQRFIAKRQKRALLLALSAGILAVAINLVGFGDQPQAFAQADTTAPSVSSIAITSDPDGDDAELGAYSVGRSGGSIVSSSNWASGVYRIGDDVKVTATFSEDVTVTGSPQLELAIGTNNRTAQYESTDGSAVIFSYTVAQEDSDSNGIAIGANELTLNSGSIKDAADNDANLSHNALTDQDDHKVDGIRPRISRVFLAASSGGSDGAYSEGEELIIVAEFTEDFPRGSVTGPPQVTLDFGGEEKGTALWDSSLLFYVGPGSSTRDYGVFGYVVQEGDLDSDGVTISANSIDLNGGFIRDPAGNDAILTHSAVVASSTFIVDAVAPTVSSIAITSDPGDDDTYGTGAQIKVTVTFSENMSLPRSIACSPEVIHCKAELELDIGGTARTAEYQSHDGADVVYAYTVQAGDTDDDGISIGANKLTGQQIRDAAGRNGEGINDADLSHDAVADDAGHKVDGTSSPLTLSGDTTISYAENGEQSVATYSLSGSDGTITWSLSGDDSDDFSLTGETATRRELSFTPSPNYEDPTDADTDNQYDVTIQASDGTNSSTLQVTVIVTNVRHDADELPGITGTAEIGETLTVDTSPIPDTDQNTRFGYLWIRIDGGTDTNIDGATNSSYTLTDDDEGKSLKVLVGFRTTGGERVRLTSAATAAAPASNSPATGVPTITGTAQVGGTLTADTSDIADQDGLEDAEFSYQWLADDTAITGATTSSYTLTDIEEGKTIQVKVSFTDNGGNDESLISAATAAVAAAPPDDSPATGVPTNSGAVQVGETLTAITTGIADEDGLDNVSYSYQWIRIDGDTDTNISEASDSSYELSADDLGKNIKVKVSFTDDANNQETLTSEPIGPVGHQTSQQQGNNTATGAPTISGTARVGETLSVSTSDIADPDGLTSATFSYQWNRGDGSTNTDITDATAATYTLQEEDLDYQVSVTVAFTDDEGNDETLTSAPVLVLAATPLSGAFDSATLPGQHDGSSAFSFEIYFSEEPVLGFEDVRDHVLDVTNGDVVSVRRTTPGSNIRWEITVQPDGDDAVALLLPVTDNCGDEGAVCTASEKKLLIGAAVFVRGPAASQEQTAANTPATGNPAVTGTARVGETLSADTSGIADADGLQNATFSFQWVSIDGTTDSDIPGETGATYVVQPGDAGKTIKVRVSFTDGGGHEESLTSAATAAVAPTLPGTPRSLEVETAGTGELAVTWQPPQSHGGSEVTGYRVEWKLATGSWDTPGDVSSTGTTETSHTIGSLSLDTEYAVRVIAVNGAGDGPPSAEQRETAVAQTSEQREESTANTAATGQPTISGAAHAEETLTADTSGIADENGLDNASFSYQWIRSDGNADTDIQNQTGETYQLADQDVGKTIKVRVSFTDDADNEESLTSAATAAVAAAANTPTTGAPTISDPEAYVTVEIKDGDDTVSWSDPGNCSSDYNLYLAVTPRANNAETSRIHLGSAASGSDEATQAISHEIPLSPSGVSRVPGVEVELYCGEYEASSLVSSTRLAMGAFNLREGTYSSAPLTALTISSGTLSPSFDKGIHRYAAEVPSDTEAITLEPAVLTGFFTDFVKNPVWGIVSGCWGGPLRGTCTYGYGDGTTTGIILNDADEDTDGFQIDLGRGKNRLGIGVNTGNVDTGPGQLYYLTITVQNSPATDCPPSAGRRRWTRR